MDKLVNSTKCLQKNLYQLFSLQKNIPKLLLRPVWSLVPQLGKILARRKIQKQHLYENKHPQQKY